MGGVGNTSGRACVKRHLTGDWWERSQGKHGWAWGGWSRERIRSERGSALGLMELKTGWDGHMWCVCEVG